MKAWRRLLSSHFNLLKPSSVLTVDNTILQAKQRRSRSQFGVGPGLKEFIKQSNLDTEEVDLGPTSVPYIQNIKQHGLGRKVKFETYGCQMNVNDTEIIWSILKDAGYKKTDNTCEADVLLLVTCAIREGAEATIWNRLNHVNNMKKQDVYRRQMKVGILGCMAERLKNKILEEDKSVDLVAGPDSYRDLPRLLAVTENNQTAVNVLLSLDETYADVMPVRLNQDSISAFVSIMRGCDNMCTYCIVPFTRGRERSRPISSIVNEIRHLSQHGVKEVTLLGQNVNSYRDTSVTSHCIEQPTNLAPGFKTVYKAKKGGYRFDKLLDEVSKIDPEMRIRFTSPHPKDFPNEVLHLVRERSNICCSLHVPAQSGSSSVLERMRRGYTRESYLDLISNIRNIIPHVTLSSDFICGFCGETDEEFEETISLMKQVQYNVAYLFAYSMREKTTAFRRFTDDVPWSVKSKRVTQLTTLFREMAQKLNESQIGQCQLVLVEGVSKKDNNTLVGRNDGNTRVILPMGDVQTDKNSNVIRSIKAGDFVAVLINAANSQVVKGIPLYHSSITEFYATPDRIYLQSRIS